MTEARQTLVALLESVRRGELEVAHAVEQLSRWPAEDVEFAQLDHHRALRTGFPEVVYCPGKTPEQAARALERLASEHGVAMATRADAAHAKAAQQLVPDCVHHSTAGLLVVDRRDAKPAFPGVLVVSAGTADGRVAEEAAITAETIAGEVLRIYDSGVAGLHRILGQLGPLQRARAIVVVAGMEGALPGVVTGLVSAPVIAVPTSVGYGAHLGGIAPLLTMLNGCAPGMSVVNIDNGFAAGYLAAMIARQAGPET